MTQLRSACYKGIFPVVPTTFTDQGALDLPSQKRCVDFMIDPVTRAGLIETARRLDPLVLRWRR